MKNVYIALARRSAVGNFMGSFASTSSVDLGKAVVQDILAMSKIDPSEISELIMGQVLLGGLCQNPARQTSIKSGIPDSVPASVTSIVCGSGLNAVAIAAQAIKSGDAKMIIAGGQENMSMAMHASYIRAGVKMGKAEMIDMMTFDGLTDAFSNVLMGITAENIAKKFNISREQQDKFSLESQQKAAKAQAEGRFKDEITPIAVKVKRQDVVIDKDEFIKPDITMEDLQKLRPAFDPNGSVTAGNASGINDGAAAVLLVDEEMLKKYNLTPLARVVSYAKAGVPPEIMGTGPIPASKAALARAGWKIDDLDLIEANEAFAVQAISVNEGMGWDISKVNVNGGAVAIGHPIGASGCRVLVTLLHEMHRRKAKKGLVTLCIGGGMGIAMCLEC
jgi:acetyl-CoA C-acetyltransferase